MPDNRREQFIKKKLFYFVYNEVVNSKKRTEPGTTQRGATSFCSPGLGHVAPSTMEVLFTR